MKLGHLAYRLLQRAYDAAVRAPGDGAVHKRLFKWVHLGSRAIGERMAACHITDGLGRARLRAIAAALLVAMGLNFLGGAVRDLSQLKNSAPPRAVGVLINTATSTGSGPSIYVANEITGQQFSPVPLLPGSVRRRSGTPDRAAA
jgi:hypothetical protein